MEKIVIVGAGGFGREVEWLINRINKVKPTYEVVGFVDDGKENGESVGHSTVIFNTDELSKTLEKYSVAIAIGNAKVRKMLAEKLSTNTHLKFPNLIDPSVIYDDEETMLGKGNIICASTIMTVNIKIGNFNIINLDCTIGHDDVLNNYITIYPSVNVSGCVVVDDIVEIGTGTQIIQGLKICSNTIIGASAAVVKSIEESGTYIGVPVKRIK